ncbi:hypothetical protein AB1Y20_004975 [Prymnesium parvum]|uniref:ABC transporter domain-containing protein n=1 Tax=Prymnesium parvum TaxID=97485 RepID=A0AB34J4W0_PRYPA
MCVDVRSEMEHLLREDATGLDEQTREYLAALLLEEEEEQNEEKEEEEEEEEEEGRELKEKEEELRSILCEFVPGDDGATADRLLALRRSWRREAPRAAAATPRRLGRVVTIGDQEERGAAGTTGGEAECCHEEPPPPPQATATATAAVGTTPQKKGAAAAPAAAPRFNADDYGSARHAALDELDDLDDHSAKWAELQASGEKGIWSGTQKRYVHSWGGRGMGGRGVPKLYSTRNPNVHLDNVTLHYKGKELLGEYSGPGTGYLGLVGSTLSLQQGRCYALIGRNGVGKSTLLKRIARGALPGFPPHLRCAYLQQESVGVEGTVLDALLRSDDRLDALRAEVEEWEGALADGDEAEAAAAYLAELYDRVDALEAEAAERVPRARRMLAELGFAPHALASPAASLSGGWRMRLSLAQCFFSRADVLLLDEPTNHLDVRGALWLRRQLLSPARATWTALLVSHEREFVEAVCTDVILFEHKKLTYHRGGLASYLASAEQAAAHAATRAAAVGKQQARQRAFIAAQRNAAGRADEGKLRQAKEREAKLERQEYVRTAGRFKTSYASPERVRAPPREHSLRFHLPQPRGAAGAALTAEGVSFGYGGGGRVLDGVTVQLGVGSRVAVVGENGAGKSTLVRLLCGALLPTGGEVRRHGGLRVALVEQQTTEVLRAHLDESAVQLLLRQLGGGVRQQQLLNHLGAFGLSGELATCPIGMLSGGQKARLALAHAMWDAPHLLILDEPTNHLDSDALEALKAGIAGFKGGVVAISHSADFVASFCKEVWVLKGGRLATHHVEDSSDFGQVFSDYCNTILAEFDS